jgi:NAD(P)H-quinone oxidoreductase subunit 5
MFSLLSFSLVMPFACMLLNAMLINGAHDSDEEIWKSYKNCAWVGLLFAALGTISVGCQTYLGQSPYQLEMIALSPLQAVITLLVQGLGVVVGVFSSRYLEGEANQERFVLSLSLVLAAVHLLLLANNWWLMIVAWGLIGTFLRDLLCFYSDRPFALLASHKKIVADIFANLLLVVAAFSAWWVVGSWQLSDLFNALQQPTTVQSKALLTLCALCLAGAVVMRTALFPVHGWLIQVMEAPTPVSALLHAGVVNLSGYVLIRFSPLLEHVAIARYVLVVIGLVTCALGALIMLTRVSIKVRLAWSTVAQMGFMIVECGLGLYTFAALHLIGHSIYKAYAFLAASGVVHTTRVNQLTGKWSFTAWSVFTAMMVSYALVSLSQLASATPPWPAWWNWVLALAWAPLLWVPSGSHISQRTKISKFAFGSALTLVLSLLCVSLHELPLGFQDAPHQGLAPLVIAAIALLYGVSSFCLLFPKHLNRLHHWVYAGLYVDAFYTRVVLAFWPISWGKSSHQQLSVNH